jgi:hypothetical protein
MAAPAPAGAIGASAAPTPARLPAVPASTNLALHPAIMATATDPTLWTLPRDSPVVWSFQFIEFVLPTAPAPAEVASFEMGATLLAAISFDSLPAPDEASLTTANVVEHGVDRAEASKLLSELLQARILARQYANVYELREAIVSSALVDKAATASSGTFYSPLTHADILSATMRPFGLL